MKKFIALLLTLVLALSLFALSGCNGDDTATTVATDATTAANTSVTVRLGGLKGPASMGMVKILENNDAGTSLNKYEFTMSGSADELTPKFLQGDIDILAVPANLGAVLYNKSNGAVKMLTAGMFGGMYIVEKGGSSVNTIADLKGKTVFATGKGSTPEYILSYLLKQSGLTLDTDVKVEWKSEATEVVSSMLALDNAVALLPEPFVTVAQTQIEGLRVAVDLNDPWNAADNGGKIVTMSVIVRSEFAEQNPEAVKNFLKEYGESVDWVNANVADAAQLIEKYDIVKAAIAEKAIPGCNMVCVTGEEMKTVTQVYFNILFDMNPEALGGTLPADDFYLIYE